jgi:hypothetical protein
MSTRSHTSFQKRQKELARMEKQREKAAKRMQRRIEAKQNQTAGGSEAEEPGAHAGSET